MSFLNSIKSLTPEELKRTKERITTDDAFAEKFQGGINKLLASDKAELRAIMTGQPLDPSGSPEGQQEQKLIAEIPKEEGFAQSALNVANSAGNAVKGVAEGIADFGESAVNSFIPHQVSSVVSGAVEGVSAAIQGEDPLKAASEGFAQSELALGEGKLKRGERSPNASLAGNVVGEGAAGVIGTSAIASKAIPLVSKVANTLGASQKIVNASKVGAVTGSDFVIGSLQIEAQKGEHGVESMIDSMKSGAAYTMFGASVGVSFRKGVPVVADWARNKSFRNLQASRGNQKLFSQNKDFLSNSKFYDSTKSTITEVDFNKTLDSVPGYNENMLKGDYFEANKYVYAQYGKLSEKKSALLSELDVAGVVAEKDAVVNTLKEIVAKIFVGKSVVGDVSINATRKAHIAGILQDLAENPNSKISLREVSNILDDIQDVGSRILKKDGEGDRLLGRLRASINGPVENAVKNADLKSLADDFIKTNKDIRVTRSSADISSKILTELNDVSQQGTTRQILGEVAESFQTIRGSATAAAGVSIGYATGISAIPAAVIGTQALVAAGKSAGGLRTIVNGVDSATRSVNIVSATADFFTVGGGQNTKTGQTLISALGRAIKEGETNEQLEERVSLMSNTMSLLQSPMDRTTRSFYVKKDALISIVEGIDPEIAKQLTSIVDSGENVGPFMEQLANHPKASEIFTPGQGWDGKTYDPALKKQLKDELLLQSLVPSAAKGKILEDLELRGIIPDMNNLPRRRPRKQ